jgi:hypothetical protein
VIFQLKNIELDFFKKTPPKKRCPQKNKKSVQKKKTNSKKMEKIFFQKTNKSYRLRAKTVFVFFKKKIFSSNKRVLNGMFLKTDFFGFAHIYNTY